LLIVGLGNPGAAYTFTRHNIGFMVIDELLRRHPHQNVSKSSFEGELYKTPSHLYLKPTTYMNLSGRAIASVKNFYKIDEVVVIHDDLDLPFGALRFKFGGGHGGHNGLKSTDSMISQAYFRVRMGIGKPQHKGEVASYVLAPFNELERVELDAWITKAADAIDKRDTTSWEDIASQCSIKAIALQ
jgi:peptidyl-tRNA hydrolase, PTH1 family